jgi:DNA-binding CsgD family transcriptional regulator
MLSGGIRKRSEGQAKAPRRWWDTGTRRPPHPAARSGNLGRMAATLQQKARNERILRLYVKQRLSTGAIARKLGLSQSRVQQILTERRVTMRSNGHPKENPAKRAHYDRIVRLYDRDNLSTTQIAERLGISIGGVVYVLRARGVKRKPNGYYPKPPPESYERHRAYAESIAKVVGTGPGFSAAELARKAGFKVGTLRLHLREMGVWMRSGVSKVAGGRLNVEQVKRIKAALAEGATQAELARRYKVGRNTIYAIAAGDSWVDVEAPGETKGGR